MAQKLRISKAGYNAVTETAPDNLVFSSDYDSLKYYASGSITLEISNGDDHEEITVAHNLGYKPFFIAYLELDFSLGAGNWSQVPFNLEDAFTRVTVSAMADNTYLYLTAYNTDSTFSSIDLNFHYKIFRNDTGL